MLPLTFRTGALGRLHWAAEARRLRGGGAAEERSVTHGCCPQVKLRAESATSPTRTHPPPSLGLRGPPCGCPDGSSVPPGTAGKSPEKSPCLPGGCSPRDAPAPLPLPGPAGTWSRSRGCPGRRPAWAPCARAGLPLPKPLPGARPAAPGAQGGMEERERCPLRTGTHRPRPLPGAGRPPPARKFLLRSPGGWSGEGGAGCAFQRRKKVTPPLPLHLPLPRPPSVPLPVLLLRLPPPAPHAMAARRGGARPAAPRSGPGAPLAPSVPLCLFIPAARTAFPPPPVPPRLELDGNAPLLPFSGRTRFSAGNVLVPTPECWHRIPWS